MKILQHLGIALFIAGFGFFNLSFFFSTYTLNQKVIEQTVSDEAQQAALKQTASDMLNREYNLNFPFLSDLNSAIDEANTLIREKYRVTPSDVNNIMESLSGNTYQLAVLDEVFNADQETGAFKKKITGDYTGWMDGKAYNSSEQLRSQLENTVASINKDIVKQKGFSSYALKPLKTSIAREASSGVVQEYTTPVFLLTYLVIILGALMYILPKASAPAGIKNNGIFFSSFKNRGWLGVLIGSYLITFYIFLYFFPQYMVNWIIMVDPLSYLLKGSEAGEFFLYGFLYTLCILVMGIRMMMHYRHSNYHLVRTGSVMFFQTAFAFLIPEIMIRLNRPYFDFKNIWPLDYDFFFPSNLNQLINEGSLGLFMVAWGIMLIVIGVPVMTYFVGKRWYCSWVCGCGGLAETLGDPYRQLSDKSLNAWKFERYSIHSVLVFAVVMTAGMIYTFYSGSGSLFGINTYKVSEAYGFFIGAGFAGVIGTGFYPFMGNRVWCRFGCPLAAYLGIIQRFKSRFRITTNGGQCISCGNCSTYCEMGIDVRWYAQRGQNIIRSSCVGCGVCSSVCPRGVLKLENGPEEGRFGEPILIGNDSITVSR